MAPEGRCVHAPSKRPCHGRAIRSHRLPSATEIPAHPPFAHARRRPDAPVTVTTRIAHRRGIVQRRGRARTQSRGAGWQIPVLGAVVASTLGVVGLAGIITASALGVMSAGLPEPTDLDRLGFDQPTIVFDRAGKVELGRFEDQRRRVLAFDSIPKTILDATTSAEDRTFWENVGVDVPALISAAAENASGTRERGASTITQQLVRARLLPEDVVQAGADRYVRKVKEIIQALRVNETYPGETGKRRVMTAYLNEIFYGHGAYGIAAAAEIYFGVHDLSKLTVAQAALWRGCPRRRPRSTPIATRSATRRAGSWCPLARRR